MNKKEIAEIKKLFTPSHCAITRICGCYVDAEKNIKTKLKEAFLSLEEEEMFKSVRNPWKESAEYGVPALPGK